MKKHGRLETGGGDKGFEFRDGKKTDVALPGLKHVGVLVGGNAGDFHQAEPHGLKFRMIGRGAVAAQIGADEPSVRAKPVGDVAEKSAPRFLLDEKMGDEQAGGCVKRFARREGVEIAGVKGAAVRKAVLGGAALAERHHRSRRLDRGEMPVRKVGGEREQFLTGAGADAEKAGVGGQIGERGAHEQEERVANRADFGEAVVVSGRVLFVEPDRSFT